MNSAVSELKTDVNAERSGANGFRAVEIIRFGFLLDGIIEIKTECGYQGITSIDRERMGFAW